MTLLLSSTPALAQRQGASLGMQTGVVADSVSREQDVTSAGGNGGWFAKSEAEMNGGRARVQWRIDGSSQIRQVPGIRSMGWDQQSANGALTLRASRVTTFDVSGAVQWSPRFSVGLPRANDADPVAVIELPSMNSLTSRFGGHLVHAFSRRRTGDAAYTAERVAASGRTLVTQRISTGVRQQLQRKFSLVVKQSAVRRSSSTDSGRELSDTLETTVGLSRDIGATTSFTVAAIPSVFRRESPEGQARATVHLGGGATVERRWSGAWRTTFSMQQSVLSGEGDTTPVYARSIGGSMNGRVGRLIVTGSITRVIGGASENGARNHGGQSLMVTAAHPVTRRAMLAAEYQQTKVHSAATDASGLDGGLQGRRLRVTVTSTLTRR